MTERTLPPHWQTEFLVRELAYEPLAHLYPQVKLHKDWPDCKDYNEWAVTHNLKNKLGMPIQFVHQLQTNKLLENNYEVQIYKEGIVPTRRHHWHDYFNMLVWLSFPKTKAAMNERQYQLLRLREGISKQRCKEENQLTHFDESGMVVVTSNKKLLALLEQHKWRELFWENRCLLMSDTAFFTVGHSIYERMLTPYIGLTASSVIFEVDQAFHQMSYSEKIQSIDEGLANHIDAGELIKKPKTKFQPVPVLGIPGWYSKNAMQSFYANENYFRSLAKKNQ